jgi:hypothetical protein
LSPVSRFSIHLSNRPTSSGIARGRIVLGDFEEPFDASLDYWSPADYRRSWRGAILRIVSGTTPSALVTSMADPTAANFLRWWPMYLVDREVRIRESLLFLDHLAAPLDPTNLFTSVPAYCSHGDEGDPISEWRLPVESLASFMSDSQHP